ncbi:hypothetical protein QTP88_026736 [Uroleucon formosanum]
MVKVADSLTVLFLIHLTCLAHEIHRVCETIRAEYTTIDKMIANVKKIFLKAPSRTLKLREMFPNLPLPPKPVLTRWTTWLTAVTYYVDNFNSIKSVISELDDESDLIKKAKELFDNQNLKNDLAYIKMHALEDISHDPNPESSCKAALYLNSVTKIDFLVALEVTDVSDIANLANVEICMPQICGRQTQRININSKDPETYFKVSVFLPFLDFILQELDARFNQRLSDIIPLQGFIPSNFSMYDDETILKAASIYAQDLSTDDNSILKAELRIWRHQ